MTTPKTQSFILVTWSQSDLFLLLVTKWLVSFIGHKVTCFFHWSQSGQCICIVITSFIVFGHKVTHAFGVDITSTLYLGFSIRFRCLLLSPFCFNSFCEINSFLPLVCYPMVLHINKRNNNTIIVKQYCPCSFLHNSSRNVSCTRDLLWDRCDNVLRLNLTSTNVCFLWCIEVHRPVTRRGRNFP